MHLAIEHVLRYHLKRRALLVSTHLYCITTFSDVCYWSLCSDRMVPTAEQISGAWRSRILRPQTSQYVGCRPYCWSCPRSLITVAALVRHKIISSCNCVLLKDCWRWRVVRVTEDSVDGCPQGKSPSLEAAGFHQQDTQMDSSPFSICPRSFIPD